MSSTRTPFVTRFGVALQAGLWIALTPNISAQIPDRFQNLRVLQEDIGREDLIEVMRGFSFALGVRCQYCHVGGDGVSFDGVEFEKDDDPDKRKARFMMRMTENLNLQVLPLLPERDEPRSEITCKTCHRGLAKPMLLSQELLRVADEDGGAAAAERYRELRETRLDRGSYDFGEWETNTVAERLADAGRSQDAITIYELNQEFHPDSLAIPMALGGLYEATGDTAKAIASYERVLELRPGHRQASERLEALRAGK